MSSPPAAASSRGSRWLGRVLVAVLLGGLAAAAAGAWRPGMLTVGVVLAASSVLRACLPAVSLGTLVVRSRWLDVLFLTVAAAVLLVAALSLP